MAPEPLPTPLEPGPADAANEPLPAAVLRHEGAPGGDHLDLLLAVRPPAGPDDAACATWRSTVDPARAKPGELVRLEPIHPHRAFYLGLRDRHALDGGRGSVVPVRTGTWARRSGDRIEFRWSDGSSTVVTPLAIDLWRIEG